MKVTWWGGHGTRKAGRKESEDGEAEKCHLQFFVGARDRRLTGRSRQRCSRWPCSNVLRLQCAIDSSSIAFSGSATTAYSGLRGSRQWAREINTMREMAITEHYCILAASNSLFPLRERCTLYLFYYIARYWGVIKKIIWT